MLSRFAKATFYQIAGPLMWLNGALYRHTRAPRDGSPRAHLGPGQKKYLPGWINVDANAFTAKCDVWSDLRDPLPFHSNTLTAAYSHHVVEHLPDIDRHFADVYRCLKPGGIYRVAGPNADSAFVRFLKGDRSWFGEWPEKRSSIGGRLENFILCKNEHLHILTHSFLVELMEGVGFRDVRKCVATRDTGAPELFDECLAIEHESDFETPRTLVLEGTK
jgi:predicted SAM-dependent methyltransferase